MAPTFEYLKYIWGCPDAVTYKRNAKRKWINPPSRPNIRQARYNTDRYVVYDVLAKNHGPAVSKSQDCPFKFDIYDGFALVTNHRITTTECFHEALNNRVIPKEGVRLDDHLCKLAALSLDPDTRDRYFPAEFDGNGMIRASRIPLGQASKTWRQAGERDLHGHILRESEEGFYWDWYAGIHPLMGREGYDQGWYLIRPSWEDKVDESTLSFKVGFPAL